MWRNEEGLSNEIVSKFNFEKELENLFKKSTKKINLNRKYINLEFSIEI